MQTPDEEAKAFARSFIARHTDWGHVFSDEKVLRIEHIAEDARRAFQRQFPPYGRTGGQPYSELENTRQRRSMIKLRNGRKIVYEAVLRAALLHELHEINKILKTYLDELKIAQEEDKK